MAPRARVRQEARGVRADRAGAGSDAGETRTRAELRDGQWVMNGSKMFITNAGTDISACVTITASTGDGEISNFVVPNGTPGYEISAPMHKLGWRASDTRELSFRDFAVPEGNLLGAARRGLQAVPRDSRRRPHLGGGDGRRARAGRVRPRVRLRARSGSSSAGRSRSSRRSSSSSPTWRRRSRRAAPRLQGRLAQGRRDARSRARRRWRSSTPASSPPRRERGAADPRRLRVHGGVPISRLFRDQKILEIGEGTNEVQRMVIAKHLGF